MEGNSTPAQRTGRCDTAIQAAGVERHRFTAGVIEKAVTSCPAAASPTSGSAAIPGSTPAMMKSSAPMTKVAGSRHTNQPVPVPGAGATHGEQRVVEQ